MNSSVATTTANTPLGGLSGSKLFRIKSGPYAGRQLALFLKTASELVFSWADAPYTSWSAPTTIATDLSDSPFDALLSSAGHIHLVYSQASTFDLLARKLTFTNGSWSVGAAVVVHDAQQNFEPSIAIEQSGKLWISWSRLISPNRTVHIKSSIDDGATWGSGPADAGVSFGAVATFISSRLLISSSTIYLLISAGGTLLGQYALSISGGSWSALTTIGSGTAIGLDFDAALAGDGRIGVVWHDVSLYYREFDGFNWGATITLDTEPSNSPQLFFRNLVPYLIWLRPWQGAQSLIMQTDRRTGSFTLPIPRDQRAKPFDSVVLYDASAGTYQDKTAQAESSTAADLFHTSSNALIADSGDSCYCGMDERFRYLQLTLSTVGAGGAVNYAYWNGTAWQVFTPVSGVHQLDSTPVRVVLWPTYNGIPADWQRTAVFGLARFWIRVQVSSSYATAPVASRLSAISEIGQLVIRRE